MRTVHRASSPSVVHAGMVGLVLKLVRLAPNCTNPNLIWKKPRICPIWGQSDPLWSQTYQSCSTSMSSLDRDVRFGLKVSRWVKYTDTWSVKSRICSCGVYNLAYDGPNLISLSLGQINLFNSLFSFSLFLPSYLYISVPSYNHSSSRGFLLN